MMLVVLMTMMMLAMMLREVSKRMMGMRVRMRLKEEGCNRRLEVDSY